MGAEFEAIGLSVFAWDDFTFGAAWCRSYRDFKTSHFWALISVQNQPPLSGRFGIQFNTALWMPGPADNLLCLAESVFDFLRRSLFDGVELAPQFNAFSVSCLLRFQPLAERRDAAKTCCRKRVLWQLGNRKRELTAIAAMAEERNAGSSSWCGVPIAHWVNELRRATTFK